MRFWILILSLLTNIFSSAMADVQLSPSTEYSMLWYDCVKPARRYMRVVQFQEGLRAHPTNEAQFVRQFLNQEPHADFEVQKWVSDREKFPAANSDNGLWPEKLAKAKQFCASVASLTAKLELEAHIHGYLPFGVPYPSTPSSITAASQDISKADVAGCRDELQATKSSLAALQKDAKFTRPFNPFDCPSGTSAIECRDGNSIRSVLANFACSVPFAACNGRKFGDMFCASCSTVPHVSAPSTPVAPPLHIVPQATCQSPYYVIQQGRRFKFCR